MEKKMVKVPFTVVVEKDAIGMLKNIAKMRGCFIGDVLADLIREESERIAVDEKGYKKKYERMWADRLSAKIFEDKERQRGYSEANRRRRGIGPREYGFGGEGI